ncbi:MAG: DUF6390 family protein [archaeon]
MSPDGLETFFRFAFPPNKLNYCGPEGIHKKIIEFLKGNKELENELTSSVHEFSIAYSYLKLIAKSNFIRDPLDERAVEAYWIGNELLEKVSDSALKRVIHSEFPKFTSVPEDILLKLVLNFPAGALPHHSFHVFQLLSLTDKVIPVVEYMDSCRIGFGKVTSFGETKLMVSFKPIVALNENLLFGDSTLKELDFIPELFPNLKEDSLIAFHWNTACMELNLNQFGRLRHYTQHTMDCINMNKEVKNKRIDLTT